MPANTSIVLIARSVHAFQHEFILAAKFENLYHEGVWCSILDKVVFELSISEVKVITIYVRSEKKLQDGIIIPHLQDPQVKRYPN